MREPHRLVIGISGASGIPYAIRLLEVLNDLDVETHLVISRAGQMTIAQEASQSLAEIRNRATRCYGINDVGAAIASGSFQTMGMIVVPCSMKSLAEIAHGLSSTLLTRAADVCLKERRQLVLCVRETPLHASHLKNMLTVAELGGVIFPPVPAFYTRPASLDDVVEHTIARILDQFGLEAGLARRWEGMEPGKAVTPKSSAALTAPHDATVAPSD